MQDLSIGELSRSSGVKVPTIRYYEEIGLMPAAPRSQGNRRIYREADLGRLRFIRHARELGFEIDAIRELVLLADRPNDPCCNADAIARSHLADIDSRLARLTVLREEVRRMIASCDSEGRIAECRVIEVLAEHDHDHPPPDRIGGQPSGRAMPRLRRTDTA